MINLSEYSEMKNPDEVSESETCSIQLNDCITSVRQGILRYFPASICLFKVNRRNSRRICEMCSKLTINALFNVNDVVLVSLLLAWNIVHAFLYSVLIIDFDQVNICLVSE